MPRLSKDFTSEEFACRCCGVTSVDPKLVAALQQMRDMVGVPIHINSGYRCPKHNAQVGGTKGSMHLFGKAADIVIQGYNVRGMLDAAYKIQDFLDGGIGIYPQEGFIHVDVRGHSARWARVNRRYVSLNEGLMYC
jgi:uncharacterized protein YcbK (DUF882 family)